MDPSRIHHMLSIPEVITGRPYKGFRCSNFDTCLQCENDPSTSHQHTSPLLVIMKHFFDPRMREKPSLEIMRGDFRLKTLPCVQKPSRRMMLLLRLSLEIHSLKKALRNRLMYDDGTYCVGARRCRTLHSQPCSTASFSSCATLYNVFIASFPCASQGRKLHKVNLSLSKHAIELILNCANPMLWSIYGPLSSKTILVAKDPVEVTNINA